MKTAATRVHAFARSLGIVSFPQAAKDFAELSQTKLPMPLLVIGGEKGSRRSTR